MNITRYAPSLRATAMSALIATSLLTASTVSAQDPTEPGEASSKDGNDAKFDALVEQANAAYEARDYDTAIALFERAYALDPQANILYNIGRIHERAGKVEEALAKYNEFLGSADVDPDLKRDALERSKLLTEIVEVRNKSKETTEPPKDEVAEPTPPIEEKPVTEPGTTDGGPGAGPFVLIGLGGLGLATAGVLALQTQEQSNIHLDTTRPTNERQNARELGSTLALGADVALGVGAVGLVSGIVWLVAASGSESDANAVRLDPVLGDRMGVQLSFGF